MIGATLFCTLLLAAGPGSQAEQPSASDLDAYQSARAGVGRDADAHVRLALWCEEHDLDAERARHLAMAALIDPGNALARALMGLVRDGDDWRRPAEVADRFKSDSERTAALSEYADRRAAMPETADAHWRLALWCDAHGLEAEATAHMASVIRLDPGREAAWKRLGYRKVGGRWMTDEQVALVKREAELQAEANRRWPSRLRTWKHDLANKDEVRAEAEDALAALDDPRAVPAVVAVFGRGDVADQHRAVQILGQIDDRSASLALARLAVFSGSADVRRVATETLRHRDVREFTAPLVDLVHEPLTYQLRPGKGSNPSSELFVEGERYNVRRTYKFTPSPTALPAPTLRPGEFFELGLDGVPYAVSTYELNQYLLTPKVRPVVLDANPYNQAREQVAGARRSNGFNPTSPGSSGTTPTSTRWTNVYCQCSRPSQARTSPTTAAPGRTGGTTRWAFRRIGPTTRRSRRSTRWCR